MTERERRFVDAYVGEAAGNATKAAELAGYSPKAARFQGSKLLARSNIQAALSNKQQQLAKQTNIEAADLLAELSVIAFSDVRQLFDEHGNLKPVHELADGPARALASVEVNRVKVTNDDGVRTEESLAKVKQWDKLRAIDQIAKLLGLYAPERKDVRVMTLEVLVAGANR